MSSLELTLLYLLAAVLGVVACRSFKLPPMLGYLVVGVVIGPNALALAKDTVNIRYLGEFGVVFLMFVIGLEFNLAKLRAMQKHVFGLGFLQVGLTIALGTAASLGFAWLAPQYWGMRWQTALALSSALAMSSTAIVVKLMAERLEAIAAHGGVFLARGGRYVQLEGNDRSRNVVARFPSLEAAEACYRSEAYQAALAHAKGAAVRDLVVVEEVG